MTGFYRTLLEMRKVYRVAPEWDQRITRWVRARAMPQLPAVNGELFSAQAKGWRREPSDAARLVIWAHLLVLGSLEVHLHALRADVEGLPIIMVWFRPADGQTWEVVEEAIAPALAVEARVAPEGLQERISFGLRRMVVRAAPP